MIKSSVIKTDIHTHLLPDIDCSGAPKISANIIKSMKSSGVSNIVLTPHFYPTLNNDVDTFIASRNKNISDLLDQLSAEGIAGIRLIPAAEVLLCPNIDNMPGLEKLCFEGTRSILIEMPDPVWNQQLIDTLTRIRDLLKLDVIIAHAERYGKSNAEMLISLGFKIQLNASSFSSFFGRSSLIKWVRNGAVFGIGSDLHIHSSSTPENYKSFIKASNVLSKYTDQINRLSLELIEQ